MTVRGNVTGLFTWGRYFYGLKQNRKSIKYYKSKNCRFDDTCGGTEECSEKEYSECAKKYADVMR